MYVGKLRLREVRWKPLSVGKVVPLRIKENAETARLLFKESGFSLPLRIQPQT